MHFLIDLFGYLGVILQGVDITARSMVVGSAFFFLCLLYPLEKNHSSIIQPLIRPCRRVVIIATSVLIPSVLLNTSLSLAVLMGETSLPLAQFLTAEFVVSAMLKAAGALLLTGALFVPLAWLRILLVALTIPLVTGGALLTSHAAGALENLVPLSLATLSHQIGAALWIGGLPCFLLALRRQRDGQAVRLIGKRYSIMSMTGVFILLAGGVVMAVDYTGSAAALIGTAYGTMLIAKTSIFLFILLLGAGNFFLVERLRRDPSTPFLRLRRFAEVELGLGITLFFVAASLTSLPPGKDLTNDRASWAEVAERFMPKWPSLRSPDEDQLSLFELQKALDQQRGNGSPESSSLQAYVPGSGLAPPRNAADIAWSEYNHHGSGIIVLVISLMVLLERTGWASWARHWPLLFIALGLFIFFRSETEGWPTGDRSLIESIRDPEYLQHKLFAFLVFGFAWFEWNVRTGRLAARWAQMTFPLLCAIGGAALLTHAHSIFNVKELLLIEVTHVPLALFALASGWARWLELRLPAPQNRIYGWIWPICFLMVGLILLGYRES